MRRCDSYPSLPEDTNYPLLASAQPVAPPVTDAAPALAVHEPRPSLAQPKDTRVADAVAEGPHQASVERLELPAWPSI